METITVIKSGGHIDLSAVEGWADNARDGLYRIEIRRVRRKRSNDQNAWLWGCIYPLLLHALNAQGWEFTAVEQVHELFKRTLASETIVNKVTGEIVQLPSSTTMMDTSAFSAYCEKLRDYASEYLGVDIPDPK